MKILSVVSPRQGDDSFVNHDSAFWRRADSIANQLRAAGHRVDFASYPWEYRSIAILTVHLRHLRRILHNNYDVVYGNSHGGTFFSLLGKISSKPLIFDMHGGNYEELLERRDGSFLVSYIRNKIPDSLNLFCSDKVICVSSKMMDYLKIEKGVSPKKMLYLPMGVDLAYFRQIDNERTRQLRNSFGNKFLVGYIGSFSKYQGVENFIEAAEDCPASDMAFMIVGGDKVYRKNSFFFTGKIPFSQIIDYYSVCDAFILPRPKHIATEIASPTKFSEYCAIGKPVLVTDVGDAACLVRKYKCGFVVKDNQSLTLRNGLLALKSASKEERIQMGINARKLAVEEFDWKKVIIPLLAELDNMKERTKT